MKATIGWLLTFWITSAGLTLAGQSMQPFPPDADGFLKEAVRVLKATGGDDSKKTYESFQNSFPALSPSQQDVVIATSNKMVALGLRAYPHFDSYFKTINAETDPSSFDQWNHVLAQILNDSRKGDFKKFERFMDCVYSLLTEQALFTSRSKKWVVSASKYEFTYSNGSPLVHVKSTDLIGTTAGDTAILYNTSGSYDIYNETWNGSGGRHTWESVGLPASDVFCELPSYSMNLSKHQYSLDSVSFIFNPYFTDPQQGVLTNQLMQTKNPSTTTYPQYVSYLNTVKIKDLIENVDFEGVFKLEGANIKGTGEEGGRARFRFYSTKGELLATARAKTFKIDTREKAGSLEASLSIYFGEDSIYHPGLNFKFDVTKREITATRGKTGISSSKFFNSHHNVEMGVDKLVWKLDQGEITLSNPGRGGQDPAFFESINLFDRKLYNHYVGITSYNPLIVMKRYCDQWRTREIGAETLAREMHPSLTTEQIRHLLYSLMTDGFIVYDDDQELIHVQDKTFNYVDGFLEKVDYDIIQLKSVTGENNAKIDLETKDMGIYGLDRVSLSLKQFVHAYPTDNSLTMRKNRDMIFNGTILAGRIDFYGRGHYFSYDSFFVNMLEIDSLLINIPSDKKDEYGQPILVPMNGILEDLSGRLMIDAPVNKSGNGDFPGYSRFVNRNPSYVYYDKYSKHKDKYPREDFYFKTDPFVMDSLKDFDIYLQEFPGEFHSASIFPVMREGLHIRADRSFGFVTQTPGEGLPLYQGRGTYFETIDLSNKGLLGQGRIHFLTTDLLSKDIIFFPDSCAAQVDQMMMASGEVDGVEFPDAKNTDVLMVWLPYEDNMLVKMKEKPFDFFDNYATLQGDVRITSRGARASGIFDWIEATLTSNDFSFGKFQTRADTAALQIKSLTPGRITFNLPNVNSDVDFEERFGTFITNIPDVPTQLPYNRYETTMGRFDWDFDKKTIDLSPSLGREYAVFKSTHPRQDGLKFNAKHGLFNMETSLLTAYDVPYIAVADAWVIPNEGLVTIGEDALMHKLLNAEIVVDTVTRHHRFYNAEVEVFGRKSYRAVADYDYVHRGGNPQMLRFQEIGVETKGDTAHTYGVATIVEADSFRLDPKIRFQGQVKLEAGDEYMTFRGIGHMDVPTYPDYRYSYSTDSFSVHQSVLDTYTDDSVYADYEVVFPPVTDTAAVLAGMVKLIKVDSVPIFENPNIRHDWFKVDDEINPKDIEITVTNATDARNERVHTGIHIRSDANLMYATLLGKKLSGRDETVFEVDGLVSYDPERDEYIAASKPKLDGGTVVGTRLVYNNKDGSVQADGHTNLGLDVQMLAVNAGGNMWKTTSDSTYTFDVVIAFGFLLTKQVWSQMARDLQSWSYDRPLLDMDGGKLRDHLSMLMQTEQDATKLFSNYGMSGKLNFPAGNDYGLVISTTMTWDPNEKTLRSFGPIGIVSISGTEIGRSVKGYLEIGKARSSDFVNLYLEPERDGWYFINYRKNELGVFSANETFNTIIKSVPDQQRLFKGKTDKDFMIFEMGSRANMVRFLRNMQYFESLIRPTK